MTMAPHPLAAVKAPLLHPPRGVGERLDECCYRLCLQLMRRLAVVRLAHRGGRVHALQPVHTPPAPAAVRYLGNDRDIVAVHRVSEPSEVRNDAVVEQLDAIPIPRRRGGMHTR